MPGLVNTTNFDQPIRRLDVSYHNNASCQASPRSPQFFEDMGRRGSFDDDDDEDEVALAKKRECAKRVAAWINQSAVRITAITSPYIPSNTSFDMLDFDLDLEEDEPQLIYDSDVQYMSEGEPYVLYSTSSKPAPALLALAWAPPPRPLAPPSDALAAVCHPRGGVRVNTGGGFGTNHTFFIPFQIGVCPSPTHSGAAHLRSRATPSRPRTGSGPLDITRGFSAQLVDGAK
ncbi:hypothetical protein K438DRAFT_1761990 [Mycena galopus ATCC 62051]|nr:hypothetical protein K438DRAFT_1761990 [Mycena galopus ATCC 62051]